MIFSVLWGAAFAPGDVGTYHAGVEVSRGWIMSYFVQHFSFDTREICCDISRFAHPVFMPDISDDDGDSCAVTLLEGPLRPFGLCVKAGLAIAPHHPDDAAPQLILAYVQSSLPLLGLIVSIVVRCSFP